MKNSLINQAQRWALMLCLLSGSACLAQSNRGSNSTTTSNVYSFLATPSTRLYGYQVLALSSSKIWTFGSPPHQFGIYDCSYWTDSAGRTILYPANLTRKPGDIKHRYTRISFGLYAVSVPLPPVVVATLAGTVVLGFGLIAITRFTRARKQTNDESINKDPERHPHEQL